MDNPGEAKFGMTKDQLFEAFAILKQKGAKTFGIHSFLASNTVTHLYYPELARQLFELAVEIKEKLGISLDFYQSFWRHWCQLSSRPGAK